jgi:hypothetical protein
VSSYVLFSILVLGSWVGIFKNTANKEVLSEVEKADPVNLVLCLYHNNAHTASLKLSRSKTLIAGFFGGFSPGTLYKSKSDPQIPSPKQAEKTVMKSIFDFFIFKNSNLFKLYNIIKISFINKFELVLDNLIFFIWNLIRVKKFLINLKKIFFFVLNEFLSHSFP